MTPPNKLIRQIAKKDGIAFKKHSAIRMREIKIGVDEVKEVLMNGEIIESYRDDRPLPSYLVLVHAVVTIDVDDQILWVITVYSPSKEEWKDGFKRRKII